MNHSGPENLKKSRPKKLVKSHKSISRKNFLAKFHFFQFQKWPKINFWTGKKFKTAKNAISRKNIFFFHEFLNFLAAVKWVKICFQPICRLGFQLPDCVTILLLRRETKLKGISLDVDRILRSMNWRIFLCCEVLLSFFFTMWKQNLVISPLYYSSSDIKSNHHDFKSYKVYD